MTSRINDGSWKTEATYWADECMEARRQVKKWHEIARKLVEANYEQDGQQMNKAIRNYEEADDE